MIIVSIWLHDNYGAEAYMSRIYDSSSIIEAQSHLYRVSYISNSSSVLVCDVTFYKCALNSTCWLLSCLNTVPELSVKHAISLSDMTVYRVVSRRIEG